MSWSGPSEGGSGRRGYHHGNLREALIDATLELISAKGPAGQAFRGARYLPTGLACALA